MNNDIRELDIFFGTKTGRISSMEPVFSNDPKPGVVSATMTKDTSNKLRRGTDWPNLTPEYKMHEAAYHSKLEGPRVMMTPDLEKQLKEMHDKAALAPKTDDVTPRAFSTGATRSNDNGRYDPEAFLSPIVIERFSEYMNKNRLQPDGSIRDGDNWQKGIPLAVYMKGMWRHMLHVWTRHRGYAVQDKLASANMEEDLCAIMFNVQGMLFELLKNKREITTAAASV